MLDLPFIRSHFPGLKTDWILFDNAGGSQIVQPVIDRIQEYYQTSNVQLGATYHPSDQATERVALSQKLMAQYINAQGPEEVIMGSSTSMLLRILALNLTEYFPKGSEIIVTNCDHEANIGGWRWMEKMGFTIKTWEINPATFTLDLDQLDTLMTPKTKLVAFTHTSNILGMVNPVKEMVQFIHDRGALACVDAVAYAPHRMIDVQEWGVDFYVFSFYKTYGPHYAMLYGRKDILLELPGNNHFFIGQDETPYKFQPGNVNYELAWGTIGLLDYFNTVYEHHPHNQENPSFRDKLKHVFDLFSQQEYSLSTTLLDFLNQKPGIRIIGSPDADIHSRVPTISFVKEQADSEQIVLKVDPHQIGIRFGDFYAHRLITELGLAPQNGVVRVSMVHYNTIEEVNKLIEVLDPIL